MTPTTEQAAAPMPVATDLDAAIQRVLAESSEPLTLSKIRTQLPAPFRSASLKELADFLHRQVAVNVLYPFPRYRSQQDRFWDRPMAVHVAALLRVMLQDGGAMPWSELRRKLPAYAVGPAEVVLQEQVAQGQLYQHPRISSRGGDRFGVRPPDPKDYLRAELATVFGNLERLGFTESQLRAGALELLHDEEWSAKTEAPAPEGQSRSEERQAAAPEQQAPAPPGEKQDASAISQAETHPDAPDASSR